jgi:hypothetical protein
MDLLVSIVEKRGWTGNGTYWRVPVPVTRCGWRLRMLCCCCGERRVIRVDVRNLNIDQALRVRGRRAQALAQQFRHRLNKLCVQPQEVLQFLIHVSRQLANTRQAVPQIDTSECGGNVRVCARSSPLSRACQSATDRAGIGKVSQQEGVWGMQKSISQEGGKRASLPASQTRNVER